MGLGVFWLCGSLSWFTWVGWRQETSTFFESIQDSISPFLPWKTHFISCSNPSLFTKSLSLVFILLLKLAIWVGLPLVEVLVCPVGPLIFPSLSSDHFLLSLINCAFIALLNFACGTQSLRLQKGIGLFFVQETSAKSGQNVNELFHESLGTFGGPRWTKHVTICKNSWQLTEVLY